MMGGTALWRRMRRLAVRLIQDRDGIAATEFAVIVPIMLVLFFGVVEMSNGITAYRKAGGPGDIVVVRLFYQWPLVVTGLGWNPSNINGNKRLLSATAAFRNEPY